MALDVKVKIDLTKPIGKIGLGIPLILEENATAAIAYAECKSLAEVITAGFDDTTKVYKAANAMFMQDNPPERIAVCATTDPTATWLNDAVNVSRNWRQLVVVTNSETATAYSAIMNKIETLGNKMFFANLETDDSTSLTVTGINKTVLFYCNVTDDQPAPVAALVGATAGLDVGSFTYKNLILKGVLPQSLSDLQIEAIHAKGGITFVTKAGDNVTTEGKTAGGEYIDIIDSKDYIISNLEYQTQKTLNTTDKIPYDNNGIAMLESVAVNVLRDAYNKGIIATNDDGSAAYTVSYAKRADTEASDRAIRKYVGGQFAFLLAGAVHEVEITGEIII